MDRAESWVGGSIEFDIIHFTESHISVRAEKPSLETTLCRTARSHPPNFLQACLNRSLHHREPISASFVSTPTDTMGSAPRPTCPLAALRQRIFNSCGSYRVGIMTGKKSIERMPPPSWNPQIGFRTGCRSSWCSAVRSLCAKHALHVAVCVRFHSYLEANGSTL